MALLVLAFALGKTTPLEADERPPEPLSPPALLSTASLDGNPPPNGNSAASAHPPPIWVLLKNGSVISGQLQSVGERWRLRVPAGELELPLRDLEFAAHSPDEVAQFQYQRVDVSNLNARLDYVQWCLAAEFWTAARTELETIAQSQPASPRYHRLRQTAQELHAAATARQMPAAQRALPPNPTPRAMAEARGWQAPLEHRKNIPTRERSAGGAASRKSPSKIEPHSPAINQGDPFDPAIYHARHGLQAGKTTSPGQLSPPAAQLTPGSPEKNLPATFVVDQSPPLEQPPRPIVSEDYVLPMGSPSDEWRDDIPQQTSGR
ncbi:MAG: hypothetical protein SFX18_04785 [Pirellulales bacterium]|nr:hypothetical protein [Pirellulales bacterium]